MNTAYTIPTHVHVGHVHLKVTDLQRAIDFYCGLLGFEITARIGTDAAFIAAGGYHHHIGLNTWYSKNGKPAPVHAAGLFHTAIVYPARKDLAMIYSRLLNAGYPFSGFADHGVSEALYLNDPDENGVELYWDRPKEQWPQHVDGSLQMFTKALNLDDLLKEL
jgi:catechol 2,3-dioxygenase